MIINVFIYIHISPEVIFRFSLYCKYRGVSFEFDLCRTNRQFDQNLNCYFRFKTVVSKPKLETNKSYIVYILYKILTISLMFVQYKQNILISSNKHPGGDKNKSSSSSKRQILNGQNVIRNSEYLPPKISIGTTFLIHYPVV